VYPIVKEMRLLSIPPKKIVKMIQLWNLVGTSLIAVQLMTVANVLKLVDQDNPLFTNRRWLNENDPEGPYHALATYEVDTEPEVIEDSTGNKPPSTTNATKGSNGSSDQKQNSKL
jgi:hypothetical protein